MLLLTALSALAGTPQSGGPGVSVHAQHAADQPTPAPSRRVAPPPTDMDHTAWVYGYWAYWAGTLEELPWDHLTHVALFNVDLNSDGTVSDTHRWHDNAPTAMELAAPHGVQVHLTLTCFDDDVMTAVLPNTTKRALLVDTLADLVDQYDAHGVSVDCEGMPYALKADLVSLVAELKERVDQVTVATPAIDWNGAYDYDELAYAGDALFIMGYGYHWSGGDPGPVAPLHGGGVWSAYSLSWTVDDYLSSGAPADRIVLGLPLYGREWPTTDNSVPGTATGRSDAVVYTTSQEHVETYERLWDATTSTPYYFRSSTSQTWYDDAESVDAKIDWSVNEAGLLGVGFWALNYDGGDPALWASVQDHTMEPAAVDSDPGDSVDDTDDGLDPQRGNNTTDPVPQSCNSLSSLAPSGIWLLGLLGLMRRRRR